MNDIAFHFVFGRNERKQNLVNLLRAILGDDCPIESINLNETEITPELFGGKSCRLDLLAMTQTGEQINIEVQIANHGNMIERSLYYWSRTFGSQLEKGQDYHKLKRVIAINILDFSLLETLDFYTVAKLINIKNNKLLTNLLDIRFLELPKTDLSKADLNCPLNRWLLFLNSRTEQALREAILMADNDILTASKDLEKLRQDKNALRLYEMREKYVMDERNARHFHHKQGKSEGKAEGRELEQIRMAKEMLKEGMDESLIGKISGLDLARLQEIKQKI